MIVDFFRRLFAGTPRSVVLLLTSIAAAVAVMLINAMLAFSTGDIVDVHVFVRGLVGAVAAVLIERLFGGHLPAQHTLK